MGYRSQSRGLQEPEHTCSAWPTPSSPWGGGGAPRPPARGRCVGTVQEEASLFESPCSQPPPAVSREKNPTPCQTCVPSHGGCEGFSECCSLRGDHPHTGSKARGLQLRCPSVHPRVGAAAAWVSTGDPADRQHAPHRGALHKPWRSRSGEGWSDSPASTQVPAGPKPPPPGAAPIWVPLRRPTVRWERTCGLQPAP